MQQKPRHITINSITKPTKTTLLNFHNINLNKFAKYSVSLIIPAYNQSKRISVMLQDYIDYFQSRKFRSPQFSYQILIVDDGSLDKTIEVALEIGQQRRINLKTIRYEKNQGKGSAVKVVRFIQGMLMAKGQTLVFADADGATDVRGFDQAEIILNQIQRNQLGAVVGSRNHQESKKQRKFLRNFISSVFNLFVRVACWTNIQVMFRQDTQCGFKLFTRKAAQMLFVCQHLQRFAFDVELIYLARVQGLYRKGIPIAESPVEWREILGGNINIVKDSINMAREILLMRILYAVRVWRSGDISLSGV